MAIPEFNPVVSLYANARASARMATCDLRLVLAGIQHGRWADFVARVRACDPESELYGATKLQLLPAFTACATFRKGTRELTTVEQVNGVVAMDFDDKGQNKGRCEWGRALIEADPFTWCCAASVGGRGFFTLVKVGVDAARADWFDDLRDYYLRVYGLEADKGCRDITRLRYVSHDANLVLNEQAQVFHPVPLLAEAPRVMDPTRLAQAQHYSDGIDSSYDVEACVRLVELHRTDITSYNGRWVALGYALAGALGEDGRDYFHRLSAFHPRYRQGECDRKFTGCLKKPSKVSLGKLFFLMREHGLEPVRRTLQFS